MSEKTVGVIVARFQLDELHEGHRSLIDRVRALHPRVLVVLGSTGGKPTAKDPLPYEVREAMVLEEYPDVYVAELLDHPISSTYWSRDLDDLVKNMFPTYEAKLYGSRQSFVSSYRGAFPTLELPPVPATTGTSARESVSMPTTRDGRKALIWQAATRKPISYPTADIAIVRPSDHAVLLIGKDQHEGLLSFPGGKVDANESIQDCALRERTEEVLGITTHPLIYLESFAVADPRYRNAKDGMTTVLFKAWHIEGEPEAGDDAKRVEWVQLDQLIERLVPWHRPLGERLIRDLT